MSLLGQAVYWYPYQFKTVLAPEADDMHLSVFQYRMDLHPECLSRVPDVASQPHLTSNAAKALHAAYEMAHEPLGPANFSSGVFLRRALLWATTATQDDSLGQCLLSYADEYQAAYADVSTRLATTADRDAAMLPAPKPIAGEVRADSHVRRAWQLLSFLYGVRGEAAYEFPVQVPGYEQNYLAWAARAPVADSWNPAWRVLAPYAAIYKRLAGAMARAARASDQSIMRSRADPQWNLPTDMRFFHVGHQSFLGLWGTGVAVADYARSGRIQVEPGATYEVGGTIDARFVSGPPPCFYVSEPSGYGIAMTCGDDGVKAHYAQLVQIPKGVPWVYWVAYTNKATVATDHLLLYADPSLKKVDAAQALRETFGPTPQSWWYVPAGFQFVRRANHVSLALYGTGAPLGNAYAHSGNAPVVPGARYHLSVDIDARYAAGKAPCVYVAEQPSGRGFAMLCARNGRQGRYSEIVTIPDGIRAVETVVFTNNATVAAARRLSFTDLRFVRLK